MKVIVNGKEKDLKAGSTLKAAVAGEPYVKGGLVSVRLSEKKVVTETRDFELVTDAGTTNESSASQPANTLAGSSVSPFGSVSVAICEQPSNAPAPRFDTFPGIAISVRDVQSLNAAAPMFVMLSGSQSDASDAHPSNMPGMIVRPVRSTASRICSGESSFMDPTRSMVPSETVIKQSSSYSIVF